MLSVIICTYNRSQYLDSCLKSIIQADKLELCEVIVIDNNSSDDTSNVVSKYDNVKYHFETKQGLSIARNRAVEEAQFDWLFFIDDDCKVRKDIFSQAIYTIDNFPFKFFTGIYKAWYEPHPPKWLPYEIGNYPRKVNNIDYLKDNFISGNVMVVHKPTLQDVSIFPLQYGMNGEKIGYGEETFVEKEFRIHEIPLGINPFMIINHRVSAYRYDIFWLLKSGFMHGYQSLYLYTFTNVIKLILQNALKVVWFSLKSIRHLKIDSSLIRSMMQISENIGRLSKLKFKSKK